MREHDTNASLSPGQQIVLVRHGPTTHSMSGWMNSQAIGEWLRRYEFSELRSGSTAPDSLRVLARDAGVIVASDAPRAHMSAMAIAEPAHVSLSPHLREIPLRIPNLGRIRLPIFLWALVLGINAKWRGGWHERESPELVRQVNDATRVLLQAAHHHTNVVAVLHANIRLAVTQALIAHGWQCHHRSHRYAHWSAWHFRPGGGDIA